MIGGPRSWPPKSRDSTKGIRGTTGYLNLSRRTQGTHHDIHTSLRSKTVRRIHEEAFSSLGAMVINVKSGKLLPSPATPSPIDGQKQLKPIRPEPHT